MLTLPQPVPRVSVRRFVQVLAASIGGVVVGGLIGLAMLQGVFCELEHFDPLDGPSLCPLPLPLPFEFPTELYVELFYGR